MGRNSRKEGEKGVRCREKTTMTTSSLSFWLLPQHNNQHMMVTRRRGEDDEEDADDNDGKESGRRRKGGRGVIFILRVEASGMGLGMGVGKGTGVGTRSAQRSRRMMTGWMQSARSECVIFSSGKTEVIGQGTAPVLVPMTSVFFGLFSHTFKIKPTLDNTLVEITSSFVLS